MTANISAFRSQVSGFELNSVLKFQIQGLLKVRHRVLKILFAASLLLMLLAAVAWLFPQQILTVDNGPVKADVLVVLGGTPDRAVRGAELFKQGEAHEILVSGLGDCESNEQLLEKDGVTNGAIILECKSRTTRENAKFSIPLLRSLGAHRVIIVTSWYHSRRALACFEHYAPDLKFYSRPSYAGYLGEGRTTGQRTTGQRTTGQRTTDNGQRDYEAAGGGGRKREDGIGTTGPQTTGQQESGRQRAERKAQEGYVKAEYLKLLGYWVCYGVRPF
jgi:uncharacterized SAM-binding protein YcdF (DUF218 family)